MSWMRRMLLSRAAKSRRTSVRNLARLRDSSAVVSVGDVVSSVSASGGGEGSWRGGLHLRRLSLPRRLRTTRWKGFSSTWRRRVA